MTEKLVTMDASYKTFELAPDEALALYSILYGLVNSDVVHSGIILTLRGTDFDVTIKGVHEG
jgi:hypothetical protein